MSMGPKNYGLLVTDQRCIFVLEKASKAAVWGALGDYLMTDRKTVDYESLNADELAGREKSVVLKHSKVRDIQIKKSLGAGYILTFWWESKSGKGTFKCTLVPPDSLIDRKKSEGTDRKTATEEYVRDVRMVLEKALPPAIVQNAKWDI